MPRTVRIQGDSAVFPGDACVHCLHPMAEKVEVLKVKQGTVRRVGVPFCEECIALREQRSPAQIRFERGGVVLSFLLAWGAGVGEAVAMAVVLGVFEGALGEVSVAVTAATAGVSSSGCPPRSPFQPKMSSLDQLFLLQCFYQDQQHSLFLQVPKLIYFLQFPHFQQAHELLSDLL